MDGNIQLVPENSATPYDMSALGMLRLYRFSLGRLARRPSSETICPKNVISLRPNTPFESKVLLAEHFAYGANVADLVLNYTREDAYVVEIHDKKLPSLSNNVRIRRDQTPGIPYKPIWCYTPWIRFSSNSESRIGST